MIIALMFLVNDNIFNHGTDIHERPEFLMTLVGLFPQLQMLEGFWESKSKSYKIDFMQRWIHIFI